MLGRTRCSNDPSTELSLRVFFQKPDEKLYREALLRKALLRR
jgi:hypothetical protein